MSMEERGNDRCIGLLDVRGLGFRSAINSNLTAVAVGKDENERKDKIKRPRNEGSLRIILVRSTGSRVSGMAPSYSKLENRS